MISGLLLWSALVVASPASLPPPDSSTQGISIVEERLEAVRKEPTDPRARLELGIAYAETEEYDFAMSELVEAIRLNPDNKENLSAQANFQLGMVLSTLDRPGLATKAYRVALEASGHPDEAIREYEAALQMSPPADDHAVGAIKQRLTLLKDRRRL